jgi:uncharacterized alpha-E superfamily protein
METKTLRKMNKGISSAKANRLFWMGRYAERVYLSLHFLRKHFDLMIDEDSDAYISYCDNMGMPNNYSSGEDFIHSYLFNVKDAYSIINTLDKLNDNAILLREEIMSESLSYIQLSILHIKSAISESNSLSELQTITDYMLAFWGSIDERISNAEIRRTIKFGKFVESADLHIRFGYSFERIENINIRLFESFEKDSEICDEIKLLAYKNQMTVDKYNDLQTLYYLNGLFIA